MPHVIRHEKKQYIFLLKANDFWILKKKDFLHGSKMAICFPIIILATSQVKLRTLLLVKPCPVCTHQNYHIMGIAMTNISANFVT